MEWSMSEVCRYSALTALSKTLFGSREKCFEDECRSVDIRGFVEYSSIKFRLLDCNCVVSRRQIVRRTFGLSGMAVGGGVGTLQKNV